MLHTCKISFSESLVCTGDFGQHGVFGRDWGGGQEDNNAGGKRRRSTTFTFLGSQTHRPFPKPLPPLQLFGVRPCSNKQQGCVKKKLSPLICFNEATALAPRGSRRRGSGEENIKLSAKKTWLETGSTQCSIIHKKLLCSVLVSKRPSNSLTYNSDHPFVNKMQGAALMGLCCIRYR